jgi:hypothetical protein
MYSEGRINGGINKKYETVLNFVTNSMELSP